MPPSTTHTHNHRDRKGAAVGEPGFRTAALHGRVLCSDGEEP
jgi:hypothetical protein